MSIGIPSILSNGHPYYYSLPWERTADFFGRVERENYKFISIDDLTLSWGGSRHLGIGYHYLVKFDVYQFFQVLQE